MPSVRSSYSESLSAFSKQELNCNITQRSTSVFRLETAILKVHEMFPVNKITKQENGEKWIIQVNAFLYVLFNISLT
jgi:hypothetical protein